jgi:hypothetical protein
MAWLRSLAPLRSMVELLDGVKSRDGVQQHGPAWLSLEGPLQLP